MNAAVSPVSTHPVIVKLRRWFVGAWCPARERFVRSVTATSPTGLVVVLVVGIAVEVTVTPWLVFALGGEL